MALSSSPASRRETGATSSLRVGKKGSAALSGGQAVRPELWRGL